jgi:hypothetical protein
MNAMRWMDRFGVDPAIAGDIAERSTDRSRVWVLRQGLAAVGATAVRDLCLRPAQTIAGVLAGWAVLVAVGFVLNALATQVAIGMLMPLKFWWWQHVPVSPEPVFMFGAACAAGAASGWLTTRLSRPSAAVLFVATYFLYAAIEGSLFAHRVLQDPHVYSRLEWTNVATSFAATLCLVPLSIVVSALRDRRHLRPTR